MQITEAWIRRYVTLFGVSVLAISYKSSENAVPKLHIHDCNAVFLECFGLRREEVVGRPLAWLLKEESYSHTLRYMYMSMKLGKSGSVVLPLKDGQDRMRHMEIDFFTLRDEPFVEEGACVLWHWVMRSARSCA